MLRLHSVLFFILVNSIAFGFCRSDSEVVKYFTRKIENQEQKIFELKTRLNAYEQVSPHHVNYHHYHKSHLGLFGRLRRLAKVTCVGGIVYCVYRYNFFGVQEKTTEIIAKNYKTFEKYKNKFTEEYIPKAVIFVKDFLGTEDKKDEEIESEEKDSTAIKGNNKNQEKKD